MGNAILTFISDYPSFFIVLIVVVIFVFMFVLRQYNLFMGRKYKEKIRLYYSEDELLQLLGRDKIVFPIVGQNDKIPVRSFNLYKKDYLYGSVLASPMGAGLQQGSIIDKSGKKYKLVRKKLQEFGMVPYDIRNLKFEAVELVEGSIVDFKSMKKDLLQTIADEGTQGSYYEIQDQVKKSQSLEELTELMESVPH